MVPTKQAATYPSERPRRGAFTLSELIKIELIKNAHIKAESHFATTHAAARSLSINALKTESIKTPIEMNAAYWRRGIAPTYDDPNIIRIMNSDSSAMMADPKAAIAMYKISRRWIF